MLNVKRYGGTPSLAKDRLSGLSDCSGSRPRCKRDYTLRQFVRESDEFPPTKTRSVCRLLETIESALYGLNVNLLERRDGAEEFQI